MNCVMNKLTNIFKLNILIDFLKLCFDIKKILILLLLLTTFYIIVEPIYKLIKHLFCVNNSNKKYNNINNSININKKYNNINDSINIKKFRKITSNLSTSKLSTSNSSTSNSSTSNLSTSNSSSIHIYKKKINKVLRTFKITD